MNILSVGNTSLDPNLGSGKTRLAWSHGFKSHGHTVKTITPASFYKPWPLNKAMRLKMRLDAIKLEKTILNGKYDLVEFYGAEFGLLIDKLSRIPRSKRPLLVAHTDGLELLAAQSVKFQICETTQPLIERSAARIVAPFISRIDHLAFSRADCFVTGCRADLNFLVSNQIQDADRCAVIEPGIDETFLKAPWRRNKKQMIVSLASWTLRKDPATTIRVVTELLRQITDLEFHVIGAPDAKTSILSAFAESLRPRIVVYPRLTQDEIVAVLSQAKVFLFPSFYEGFGMATTESMACGCAVVVTPTGFGESIRDGFDGFVCNFQDSTAMIQRCMSLILDDKLRERLANAGREQVCDLSWPAQVSKLVDRYNIWIKSL